VFQLGKSGGVARDHIRCPLFSAVGGRRSAVSAD
jgi:hypothetical protein